MSGHRKHCHRRRRRCRQDDSTTTTSSSRTKSSSSDDTTTGSKRYSKRRGDSRRRSNRRKSDRGSRRRDSREEIEPVVCGRIATTLEFSGFVKEVPPCEPLFLPLGFASALASNVYAGLETPDGEPITPAAYSGPIIPALGTQEDIILGRGFSFEQVVPADSNCCTVAYHLQECELKHCERYVLTIAVVEQCGPGLCGPGLSVKPNKIAGVGYWSIKPIANIPLDTVSSQDLCGKLAAPFAALTGVKTVVAPIAAGSLVAVYLTIIEAEKCPAEQCKECPEEYKAQHNKYNGCGGILVTLSLS